MWTIVAVAFGIATGVVLTVLCVAGVMHYIAPELQALDREAER